MSAALAEAFQPTERNRIQRPTEKHSPRYAEAPVFATRGSHRQTEQKSKRAAEVPRKLLMHSSKRTRMDGWRAETGARPISHFLLNHVLGDIQHVHLDSTDHCFNFSGVSWVLRGKYNIGRALNQITGDADGRFFTLRTILLSDVGVRPTHRANLQGSPSTCSVTPNSDV